MSPSLRYHPGLPTIQEVETKTLRAETELKQKRNANVEVPFTSDHLAFVTQVPTKGGKNVTVVSSKINSGTLMGGNENGYAARESNELHDQRVRKLIDSHVQYVREQKADFLVLQGAYSRHVADIVQQLNKGSDTPRWQSDPNQGTLESSYSNVVIIYNSQGFTSANDHRKPIYEENGSGAQKERFGSRHMGGFLLKGNAEYLYLHNINWEQQREYPGIPEQHIAGLLDNTKNLAMNTTCLIGSFNQRIVDNSRRDSNGQPYLVNSVVHPSLRAGVQGIDFTDGGFVQDEKGVNHTLATTALDPNTGRPFANVTPPTDPMPKLWHPAPVGAGGALLAGCGTALYFFLSSTPFTWPVLGAVAALTLLGGLMGGFGKREYNNRTYNAVSFMAREQWRELMRQRPFVSRVTEEHAEYAKAFDRQLDAKTLGTLKEMGVYFGASTNAFNHKMVAILCPDVNGAPGLARLIDHLNNHFKTVLDHSKIGQDSCFRTPVNEVNSRSAGFQLFIPVHRVPEAVSEIKKFLTPAADAGQSQCDTLTNVGLLRGQGYSLLPDEDKQRQLGQPGTSTSSAQAPTGRPQQQQGSNRPRGPRQSSGNE